MKIIKRIGFTEKEREILKEADNVLSEFYKRLQTDHLVQSWESGELIHIEEIPRVRGILGGLSEDTDWEIM